MRAETPQSLCREPATPASASWGNRVFEALVDHACRRRHAADDPARLEDVWDGNSFGASSPASVVSLASI